MKMVTAVIRTTSIGRIVVDVILEHGRSGIAGDGITAVAPLEYAVKMRTKERPA